MTESLGFSSTIVRTCTLCRFRAEAGRDRASQEKRSTYITTRIENRPEGRDVVLGSKAAAGSRDRASPGLVAERLGSLARLPARCVSVVALFAGSTGGAIAATVVAVATRTKQQSSSSSSTAIETMQDFATCFIQQRGGGPTLLQEFLVSGKTASAEPFIDTRKKRRGETPLLLHIATNSLSRYARSHLFLRLQQ